MPGLEALAKGEPPGTRHGNAAPSGQQIPNPGRQYGPVGGKAGSGEEQSSCGRRESGDPRKGKL